MNNYTERLEARRERYEALAVSKQEKGVALHDAGMKSLSLIPFGQPVLVGHHSERAHRNYHARAVGKIGRGFEEMDKAKYYANKAESVGTAGISQDDPEAIQKLKEKLAGLEAKRETLKALNKGLKAKGESVMPAFHLTNLGANIRTVKERIERLEKASERPEAPDVVGVGYILRENKEANRLQFIFEGKPSDAIRSALKSHGFRWSPTANAWQAFLTNRSRYQAKLIIQSL